MSTIFISHSSRDNQAAKDLERQLARQGHHSVFLDLDPEKGIVVGKSWEQTLYRKLRACRSVVALCSDNYLKSHWCFAEIALARMEGKHIFALKVEGLSESAKLPSILTEKQYIDLRQNPEDGYRRLWRGLKEMDLLGEVGDWSPKDPPYLGLSSYQEKHAPVFFGRESESRACVELLDRGSPGLIMTLGASGTGKSSLVKAGVIPRLRRHPDRWLILDPVRPGNRPFSELAQSLLQGYRRYAPDNVKLPDDVEQLEQRLISRSSTVGLGDTDLGELTEDERVQRLMRQLEELHLQPPSNAAGSFLNFLDWSLEDLRRICGDPDFMENPEALENATVLTEITHELCRMSDHGQARVLLVVDQFEELLTDDRKDEQRWQQSRDFLELIRNSIEAEGSRLTILATMRSDFLGAFQRNPVLQAIDFESLSLGPVMPESMRKIIEAPAKLGAIKLEDGLTDLLIADTETADALPLLSFTLWVMWRDFRDDGVLEILEYEKLGGLHGAIAREADALYEKERETVLRDAFLELTTLTDRGTFTRRVTEWENPRVQPAHDILEKFIDKRLLMSRAIDGTRMVEVAHEALFRSWMPLNGWLNENRKELLLKQEIARDAKSWVAADRSNDNLWRGARLIQANELLTQNRLEADEKAFIKIGVRKKRNRHYLIAGITAAVFAAMAVLTWTSILAKKKAIRAEKTVATVLNLESRARKRGESAVEALLQSWVSTQSVQVQQALRKSGASGGKLDISSGEFVLDESVDQPGFKSNLVIAGRAGGTGGRIIAVAHDALVAEFEESIAFIKTAIFWTTPTIKNAFPKVLYTKGHCEVVSDASFEGYRLPAKKIEEWGYALAPIENLADEQELTSADLLIVGNAWADFSQEEIESVTQFVAQGGGLLMAGLRWSWEAYKSEPDPCAYTAESLKNASEFKTYPMNVLGAQFGIKWD